MSNKGSNSSSIWSQWCLILSAEAPTYGSQQRCLHLRPGWNKSQVQQLLTQTQQVLKFTKNQDPFGDPELGFLKEKNWLKDGIKHPARAVRYLKHFLDLIATLKQELPESRNLWPPLKAEIQPTQDSHTAQHILQKYRHGLEQQLHVVDEIGTWYAKARYGRQRQLQLTQISQQQRWDLKDLEVPGLSPPLTFSIDKNMHSILLGGAHSSGKSAFLKALYLLMMQHQCGVPCVKKQSALPVYAGISWLPATQTLSERFQVLKPLLHSKNTERLILIDDFLTLSSPGESHALARAILEQLTQKGSLNILSTYDRMLMRQATTLPGVETLTLKTQQKKTQLQWGQSGEAQLLQTARHSGLPADLIKQAEKHLKALQTPAAPAPPAQRASPPRNPGKAASFKVMEKKNTATPGEHLKPVSLNVAVGTRIYVPRLRQYGEVVKRADRRQKVQVRCEGMYLHLPVSELRLSSHRQEKKHHQDTPAVQVTPASAAPECCDLHGFNVLEAIPVLEKHLDMAYHAGEKQLRVVHGKGTNALRRAVHEHLEYLIINDRYATAYRLGYTGEGDSGVTVVTLKS